MNEKISQLNPGNPAQTNDLLPIARGGVNFSITAGSIAALASGGVTSFTGDGVVLSNSDSTGAVTATLESVSANLVLAGPATGTAATPTFRSLAAADIPTLPYLTNPMTTLGDIIYENATPAPARLAGNTTATKNFLTQTGTGSISAAPAWGTLAVGDLPTGYPWSSLGNPAGNLSLSMGIDTTTFNQTSNTPWLWANTTTATSSTTNASPLLELAANYWTGAASAQDLWTVGSTLAAGTNGKSILALTHSGSTGSAYLATNSITTVGAPALILDVNANGGQITFTQQRGATEVGTITFGTGGGVEFMNITVIPQGGTFGLNASYTSQSSASGVSSGILNHLGSNGNNLTATSGNLYAVDIGSTTTVNGDTLAGFVFAPTSTSSCNVYGLRIDPTINVGAAVSWTGSSTMLLVNPTLTATGSGTPTINLMDLQVGGSSRFTIDQHGHKNNCPADVQGSVSSAPTGIVATTVVVAVGAATATFTVSSTEGFTIGDTVTLSASGWTGGSGLASSTATVTTLTSPTVMVLTRATGGPWVAGTYSAQTGTLTQTGGTTVSVTYATAYTSTPTVVVTPTSNAGAFYLSASSTTGFTITYASSGTQTFNYMVMGNPS